MLTTACEKCGRPVPLMSPRCHACDWPARPSNVRAAEAKDEREALDLRYRAALDRSAKRGCADVLNKFESLASKSEAVIALSLKLIDALFADGKSLFATYYQQLDGNSRPPSAWDERRRLADTRVFPGYSNGIHFAALTLDGQGLPNYGDCFLVARESLIEHRATVMHENSVLFSERHSHARPDSLPKGFRATWGERAKVAVAKLADRVDSGTPEEQFPGILMKAGGTRDEDEFIEVHIQGSMSIQTFARASLLRKGQSKAILRALRERLANQGITVEER